MITLTLALKYVIAACALFLIVLIILQPKEGGLGTSFGGTGGGGEMYRAKRGFEAWLQRLTIITLIVFVICALVLAAVSV